MVTGEFRGLWSSWWSTPPFPLRERLTRLCGYSQRQLVAHSKAGRKRAPALGRKPRPARITETQVCLAVKATDKRCFSVACSLSFDITICVITTETSCARVLFPHFLLGHVESGAERTCCF